MLRLSGICFCFLCISGDNVTSRNESFVGTDQRHTIKDIIVILRELDDDPEAPEYFEVLINYLQGETFFSQNTFSRKEKANAPWVSRKMYSVKRFNGLET
ncbi:MAG: hypothetical protein GX556_10930 [Fibrobacter sp.]|nr:hypothetical protein [Fibrobacter sp.]